MTRVQKYKTLRDEIDKMDDYSLDEEVTILETTSKKEENYTKDMDKKVLDDSLDKLFIEKEKRLEKEEKKKTKLLFKKKNSERKKKERNLSQGLILALVISIIIVIIAVFVVLVCLEVI